MKNIVKRAEKIIKDIDIKDFKIGGDCKIKVNYKLDDDDDDSDGNKTYDECPDMTFKNTKKIC